MPGRDLDRRTVGAPRHQTILERRFLAKLANQPHSGDGERQDDDQTDERRRPALVRIVIAIPGSVIHHLCPQIVPGRYLQDTATSNGPHPSRAGDRETARPREPLIGVEQIGDALKSRYCGPARSSDPSLARSVISPWSMSKPKPSVKRRQTPRRPSGRPSPDPANPPGAVCEFFISCSRRRHSAVAGALGWAMWQAEMGAP